MPMNKLDNIINEEINKFILREKWYNPFSWGKNELDKQDINGQDDLSNLGDGENEIVNDTENEDENSQQVTPSQDIQPIERDNNDNIQDNEDYTPPIVYPQDQEPSNQEYQNNNYIQQPQQVEPNYNYNYNTVNASDYVDMNGNYPISNALYKLVQNKKLRNSSRIFNVMKDLEAIGW